MTSVQSMDRHARKPVGPAHILWNIVADNDVFSNLKKSWAEEGEKSLERKANKKRAGEHSLIGDESRISKRKQQSSRSDSGNATPIGMVPWTKSKLYTNDIIGLHEEIIDLYHWLCPRNWEIRLRCKIVNQIKKVVKEVWPCAKVRIFGSTRTKLFLPTSDLDIVVSGFEPDVEWDSSTEPNHPTAVELLVMLRQALIARKVTDEAHSVVIDKAQVPIVKLTELRTKLSVDITFSAASSINAVKFVNDWQSRCSHTFRPLAFVLKQFIAHRELNEVFYGGLSSYGLILMLINFFQLHERGCDVRSTSANLGVLLLEFLELYGINYNYRVVGIDPSGHGSRFARQDGDVDNPQQQHMLSVLDPFNKDNDVTRGSFAFEKIQSAFHFAYCELEALIRPSSVANSDRTLVPSILSSVMQIHPETVFHRVWAERAFSDFVHLYGSDVDDKPMEWNESDTSSDEGNPADSFEHDDECSLKESTHPRTSSAPVSDPGIKSADGESPLSNIGDELDDQFEHSSPSLFVKIHNGLPDARMNNLPMVTRQVQHNPMHAHLHHHQHRPFDEISHNNRPNNHQHHLNRGADIHRSNSMPPFTHAQLAATRQVFPVTNSVQQHQDVPNLLAGAQRASMVVPRTGYANISSPTHHGNNQDSSFPNHGPSQPHQGRRGEMNSWGQNRTQGGWMHGPRRSTNLSESSSNSNDQPPQQHHHHPNPNLPRRFHQQQQQNQGNMNRRGSNDRYGRMHGYFNNSHHGHNNNNSHHHYQNRLNYGGNTNFRKGLNHNNVGMHHSARHYSQLRGNQQSMYQQQDPIFPSGPSDLDSSNTSDAINDELIHMKIDRDKKSKNQQQRRHINDKAGNVLNDPADSTTQSSSSTSKNTADSNSNGSPQDLAPDK